MTSRAAISIRGARRHVAVAIVLTIGATLAGCGGSADERADTTSTIATVASTTTVPTTAAPGPLVQRSEPPLPAPVQESAAAVTPTALYVVGGFDSNRQSVATVSIYNGTSWSNGPTLPMALNHPAAAAVGSDVYIAGGFNSGTATDRTFVLHDGASSWTELPALHDARGAATLVNAAGTLYVMGGNAGAAQIADVERYDPAAETWTVVTQMPHPRNHLAGYVDAGRVCAAGGREPQTSAAIDCLDPATQAWTSAALPIATSGAAAGIVDGVLVVAGGEPSGETSIVPDVQQLRGSGWTNQPMLVPRHGTGFALLDGRLWMCGGGTAPGYAATDTCTSIGR